MALSRFIAIRRTSSGTPLARRFQAGARERGVGSRASREHSGKIPWEAFNRARYSAPALALSAHAQRSLALGEYGAVHLFARLASALALNAAPFDVVRAASAIPADEARHAELALRM